MIETYSQTVYVLGVHIFYYIDIQLAYVYTALSDLKRGQLTTLCESRILNFKCLIHRV